jgi:tetratricopeptide (TPR) repeat protein
MKTYRRIFYLLFFSILVNNIYAQDMKLASRYFEMSENALAKSVMLPEALNSTDANVMFLLGKIYQSEGNTDSANIIFNKIMLAYQNTSFAYLGQILIDYNNKKPIDASLYYKAEKSATSQKNLYALTQVTEVKFITMDTNNWKQPLTTANNINAKYVRSYILAGDIYSLIGETTHSGDDYGVASGRYEQALYYEPKNSEARTKLSYIYILGRNYSGAENALFEVLTHDTAYIPALKAMGELEYTLGKYPQASYYFGKYVSLTGKADKSLQKYINILYFNKEYAKAYGLITELLAKDPDNEVLLRLKGYTSFELKKYAEGLEAMRRFFELRTDPQSDKIIASDYEYYGKLLGKTGNEAMAAENLTKAIQMDSTKANLNEDLAKVYEKMKNYPEAIAAYDRLIASSKSLSSGIYFSKGLAINFLASDSANSADTAIFKSLILRADSAFMSVSEISPNSHLGYLYRARMQSKLDPESETGAAKPFYDKAFEIISAKNDTVKFRNEILEIYRYLGYYHYLQFLSLKEAKSNQEAEENRKTSIRYWEMILAYEPKDKIATEALKACTK